MTPRFYLDENFSQKLAALLRSRGVDAISAHEVGNEHLTDSDQLRYAAEQQRAIVTCDHSDFLPLVRDWATFGEIHAGVIVSYKQCSDDLLGQFAARLRQVADLYTAERLQGALVILDAFR